MNKIFIFFTTIKFRRLIRGFFRKLYVFINISHRVTNVGIDENADIIVSLTSYPARMNTVHKTLITLLTQNIKPKMVILWLTKNQFPNGNQDIPFKVKCLIKYGLKISWCDKEIKSHTKLIPSLQLYSNNIIVVADDDIYYRKDWLKELYDSYKEYPNSIHTNKFRYIKFLDSSILPYNKWEVNKTEYCGQPSFNIFLMGVGGVLFPPNSLHKDVFNYELCMELAPKADDIWFWAMALRNSTTIVAVDSHNNRTLEIEDVNNDNALWNENAKGLNDVQLQNIFQYFPEVINKIK